MQAGEREEALPVNGKKERGAAAAAPLRGTRNYMMENTQAQEKVPEAAARPAIWLVSGDVRRRLVPSGGQMRTHVGLASLIDQYVETIPIDEIERVEVMAPYSPPSSRLGMLLIGCAVGVVAGSESGTMTGMVLAITVLAFALVTFVIARTVPSSQRIARISMTGGKAYCIAYRHEDQEEVRRLFQSAEWCDRTDDLMVTALTPEETHRAQGMRIGIVLSVSALALLVLHVYDDNDGQMSDLIGVPSDIIIATAWCVTIIVNLVAWGKMAAYRLGHLWRPANRRRP